jgi:hypothetical protein
MVNIDTVYQRVLAIANKEQRGYITPLEFNLLANQAAIAVFEQYFYDRNKLADLPGNSTEFSDTDTMLSEKITLFAQVDIPVLGGNLLPTNLYRLGSVYYEEPVANWAPYAGAQPNDVRRYEAKLISTKEWLVIQNAPLLKPTNKRPVYIRRQGNEIAVFGNGNQTFTNNVVINFIAQPDKVEWGYDVVGEKALHNGTPGRTIHFQHHSSDETTLVLKILELAGVIIEDQGVVQYANTKDSQIQQQQKS